jgi:hypothetical protein
MKKEKQKFWGIQRILFLTLTAMFLSLSGFTQNVISGAVASADDEPIPGATIVILKLFFLKFSLYDEAVTLYSRGKWENWYRGETKINVKKLKLSTEELLNSN